MSFWAGLARGFADADAKKEREATRAEAEAARKEARDYSRGRDSIADARYESEQKTAAEQAKEAARRWQLNYDATLDNTKANREWRQSEAERSQSNIDRTFEREDKYGEREWALKIDKLNFTKDQADVAQANADRIFNQGIKSFKYDQSRDVIADLRMDRAEARAIANELYAKERDLVGDEVAAQNRADRLEQFRFQVERAGVSDEQWAASMKLKEDELEISRTSDLLKMIPTSLSSSLGGGSSSTSTSGKGSTTLSTEAMKEGSLLFKAEFKNLDEDTKKSEFFQAAAKSPGAQATIMAFVEAQGKKGNTIDLTDVPKYFKYLGATEGKGEAEAKEFLDSLVSGDESLGDKDTFIKGMMAMRNYKPTKQLFIQTDSPASIDDASKQLPVWENAVEVDAYRALPNLTGAEKAEVQKALGMLERKENKTQGLDILAKYGYGSGAVKQYNMEDNPVISSYYGGREPQATPTEPQAAVTQSSPKGVTVFKDWDEVTAARAEGFTGKASVGGVTYSISPLETPPAVTEGTGPETPPAAVEGTGPETVNGDGFRGTGYVRPPEDNMDTDIDRLFNEASNLEEAAVEGDPIKFTRAEETPDVDLEEGVENLSDIPDTFESPEEFEKSVDFVLEEIEELGINLPTTNTELSEFRDDLKELVYEMGADIPKPVLQEVIKRATDNAKGGLSVTGTAMDAHETGLGQGGNPEDTPVGTQIKNMTDRMGITEPDIKKRKRKPEPAPELNRSEVYRLKRAVASGDEGILSNLVEKYGEEKIAEVLEGLGL